MAPLRRRLPVSQFVHVQEMAELLLWQCRGCDGKTVRFDGRKDLVVTAVFENLSVHSTDHLII